MFIPTLFLWKLLWETKVELQEIVGQYQIEISLSGCALGEENLYSGGTDTDGSDFKDLQQKLYIVSERYYTILSNVNISNFTSASASSFINNTIYVFE